jgi:hypothetical protein
VHPESNEVTLRARLDRLAEARERERSMGPATVICGCKEWVFSDKAGALGEFAAATEYAFTSVIQVSGLSPLKLRRCLNVIPDTPSCQNDMSCGGVRLHYGHPDIFDKLHIMTRVSYFWDRVTTQRYRLIITVIIDLQGGVSKATKNLHVSEDVFGGLNHILKGGISRFTEVG